MEDRYRVIDGGDTGNRDFVYMKRMAEDKGFDVTVEDRTTDFTCIGLWGPNARENLQAVADDPDVLTHENFPFAAIRTFTVNGVKVTGFRISYVGEQGWELHCKYEDGLALWDALYGQGVTPIGVETYANSRRLEKSLRLQNADLLTNYNLMEADLARPKVKEADFHGKAAYIDQRARDHQAAKLCTLVMTDNIDSNGVARYPVGNMPIMTKNGDFLIDSLGRRSFITSVAYGPTIGKNICLSYLPHEVAEKGNEFIVEYMGDKFPVEVAGVGYEPLYDPENLKPRT